MKRIPRTYVISGGIILYSMLGVALHYLTLGAAGHDLNTAGVQILLAMGLITARNAKQDPPCP